MYGTALRPPTIGEVSERVWWAARAAVVEELGLADGNVVITEEQGTRAADLLRGVVPASPTVPALRGHALREWYKARRAVVDLLLPLVIQRGGAVIPPDTAAHIRGLLNGTVRVPTLRDARTLAKSKAPAYELAKPKLDEHAVVPF